MKRDGFDHPKFKRLARRLGLETWAVEGLLGRLWHVASKRFPAGDVGRFSNEDIAIDMGYGGDPDELVTSLVECRLLDEIPEQQGRLYIHDWHEHCEDTTHRFIARNRRFFANGEPPSLSKLTKLEREEAERWYSQQGPPWGILGGPKPPKSPTGGNGRLAHARTAASRCPSMATASPLPQPDAHAGEPPGAPDCDGSGGNSAPANSGVEDRDLPPLPGDAYRRAEELYGQSVDSLREYFRGEVGRTARSDLTDAIEVHLLAGREVTPEHIQQASARACASWNRKQLDGAPRSADPLVYELNALVNPPPRDKRNGQSKISGSGRSGANASTGSAGAGQSDAPRRRRGSEAAERYFNRT